MHKGLIHNTIVFNLPLCVFLFYKRECVMSSTKTRKKDVFKDRKTVAGNWNAKDTCTPRRVTIIADQQADRNVPIKMSL